MEQTLKEFKLYTLYLLKDFDIQLTKEIKEEIKEANTYLEVEKIRDRLINKRLK